MEYYMIDSDVFSADELYHYGVKGMKWGIRRKLRKSDEFQISKKAVKASHRKYIESEGAFASARYKAEKEFDTKRPYNPNASPKETTEWNVDRYVHVLNKTHTVDQKRIAAKEQYKTMLDDTVNKYSTVLIGNVRVSDRQRQRVDKIVRDELVKDLLKDD